MPYFQSRVKCVFGGGNAVLGRCSPLFSDVLRGVAGIGYPHDT
jgi:hypothetical protein